AAGAAGGELGARVGRVPVAASRVAAVALVASVAGSRWSLSSPGRVGVAREESMRVLITGITGFAGSHLAEYILAEHPDVAVFGTYRWRSRMENLDTLMAKGVLDVIEGRYSSGAGQADQAHK